MEAFVMENLAGEAICFIRVLNLGQTLFHSMITLRNYLLQTEHWYQNQTDDFLRNLRVNKF